MEVTIEEKNGHKMVVARPGTQYGIPEHMTPLEAEKLADELRKAAQTCRGGVKRKQLGDY
ncbi:MAG TPA: hypothetical protein VMU02_05800 [bacterium]|nr:hypothetical protein [bacterium]